MTHRTPSGADRVGVKANPVRCYSSSYQFSISEFPSTQIHVWPNPHWLPGLIAWLKPVQKGAVNPLRLGSLHSPLKRATTAPGREQRHAQRAESSHSLRSPPMSKMRTNQTDAAAASVIVQLRLRKPPHRCSAAGFTESSRSTCAKSPRPKPAVRCAVF